MQAATVDILLAFYQYLKHIFSLTTKRADWSKSNVSIPATAPPNPNPQLVLLLSTIRQVHNLHSNFPKLFTVLVAPWRLLEFNFTVKVTVVIQRNQCLSIGSCMNQTFHAHAFFLCVTWALTAATSHGHSNQKDEDKIDSTVPRKEESGNHKFVRVILFPWRCTGNWVVENETHLPEPRSLSQKKIRAPQWS